MSKKLDPVTPGEILLEEYLKPMGISQNKLARAIDVPHGRVNDIIRGQRSITRGSSPDLWINLQARYDAKIVTRDFMPSIATQIRPRTNAAP